MAKKIFLGFLKISVKLFLLLMLMASIALLALPIWADFGLTLIVALALRFNIAGLITTIISVLLLSYGLSLYPLPKEKMPVYRPHEKYQARGAYMPNVSATMEEPYGDLYAIDAGINPEKREKIKEPRTVEFITDKYGFRNNLYPIEEADIILGGDSYIVGTGNTQSDIPSNVLSQITGFKVANIAFPSHPAPYIRRINQYIDKIKDTAKIYVFYCEGNDFGFSMPRSKSPSLLSTLKQKYLKLETSKDLLLKEIYPQDSTFFRKIRARSHMINRKLLDVDNVVYFEIDGHLIGELRSRVIMGDPVKVFSPSMNVPELAKRINGVFFIPSKHRIYASYIHGKPESEKIVSEFRKAWEKDGIPAYDLTPMLQKRAAELLEKGEFVFWKDDTHWNRNGIEAAMQCVKSVIADRGKTPPEKMCQ